MPSSKVELIADDVERCWEFAAEAWSMRSQSIKQFGSKERRGMNAFLADQVQGKLTEVAMEKFFANHGLTIDLDFAHYADQDQLDEGDITAVIVDGKRLKPSLRLDVKGTNHTSQWLLIEKHKYISDIYLLIRFLNLPSKREARENPEILRGRSFNADVVGWAEPSDFCCPDSGFWFKYTQGDSPYAVDQLPTQPPASRKALGAILKGARRLQITLDAPENYGLPIPWLRRDWQGLVERVRRSASPNTPLR